MSVRLGPPLIPGAAHIGFRGYGYLGSQFSGDLEGDTTRPSFGYPSIESDELTKEVCFVVDPPLSSDFNATELTDISYEGPDTTFNFTKLVYGVADGIATATIEDGEVVEGVLVGAGFPQTYAIQADSPGPTPVLVGLGFPQTYVLNSEVTMYFTPSVGRTLRPKPASKKFSGGEFWDLTDQTYPIGFKDLDDTIDIPIDWTDVLADIGGDTIAEVEFTPGGGLVSAGEFAAGALTTIFLAAGGSVNEIVDCKVHIVTGSTPPREHDLTFFLKMRVG